MTEYYGPALGAKVYEYETTDTEYQLMRDGQSVETVDPYALYVHYGHTVVPIVVHGTGGTSHVPPSPEHNPEQWRDAEQLLYDGFNELLGHYGGYDDEIVEEYRQMLSNQQMHAIRTIEQLLYEAEKTAPIDDLLKYSSVNGNLHILD